MSMKRRLLPWIAVALCTPPLGLIVTPPASANLSQPPAQESNGAPADDSALLSDKKPRPLSDILRRMSRVVGVQIVSDTVTGKQLVSPPADPTTADNFEAQLAALVKALPNGTQWGKLMLPDRKGRLDGDAVAAYAEAEAKLFGPIGGRTGPGEVEILGQHLASEKAQVHISGLNLVPVYLISNARTASNTAAPGQWSNLSPQEKREFARQQATQLANSDPAFRNAIAQQYFMIFNQLLPQLSPTDRQSLFSSMGGPGEQIKVILRNGPGPGNGDHDIIVAP